MGRTFAYCRVSTIDQTVDNQILAIRNAGYEIESRRVISETITGATKALERSAFSNLVYNKIESGDTLVVLKLDRLGRDNIDLQETVNHITGMGVRLVCLDLPCSDLSTSEGKLMLQLMASFAEFERNRIRQRVNEGLARARSQGRVGGRPTGSKHTAEIQRLKLEGYSQSNVANMLNIGLATVKRHWNKEALNK